MEQWYLYKKKADFNQIGEKFNIDPVIARLIRNRDVVGDEQIQQYLYGELSDISDPFLMKGVKEGDFEAKGTRGENDPYYFRL